MTDEPPAELLPVPYTADPDSEPFWEGIAQKKLLVALGRDGSPIHPPRSTGINAPPRRVEVSGHAAVHSWTVVRRTVDGGFPAPYPIALVELVDYPPVRFVGDLSGAPALQAGMPMHVTFEQRSGTIIPQWRVT